MFTEPTWPATKGGQGGVATGGLQAAGRAAVPQVRGPPPADLPSGTLQAQGRPCTTGAGPAGPRPLSRGLHVLDPGPGACRSLTLVQSPAGAQPWSRGLQVPDPGPGACRSLTSPTMWAC